MDRNEMLKELERKSDYTLSFMEEIFTDISKLSDYPTSTVSNKLEEVNTKIDYARSQGIKVDSIDNLLLEFRIVYFFNLINKKIEDINKNGNTFNTNLSILENEYSKLMKEEGVDKLKIEEAMNNLRNHTIKVKLLIKLKDFAHSSENSIYSLDEIQADYFLLKERGINLDDVEKILFEI